MRVLITGAGGFLGGHLLASKPQEVEAVAWLHRTRIRADVLVVEGDLADPPVRQMTLEEADPTAILHVAAVADTGACERDPGAARSVNVDATSALASWAGARNLPFLFASTDLVFDGGKAPYTPEDPPSPVMAYGRQKAEAEAVVRAACPEATIARLPLLYGASPDPRRGLVDALRAGLERRRPLRLFRDEFRSAAHVRCVAVALWDFLQARRSGIWHFGGPERLSRVDIARAVAKVWELDPSPITPVDQASVRTTTLRPADVCLDSRRTAAAGYEHGSLEDELCLVRDGRADSSVRQAGNPTNRTA